jgi:hypothetical protein
MNEDLLPYEQEEKIARHKTRGGSILEQSSACPKNGSLDDLAALVPG